MGCTGEDKNGNVTYMNSTPKDWGLIISALLILWFGVAIFFIAMLSLTTKMGTSALIGFWWFFVGYIVIVGIGLVIGHMRYKAMLAQKLKEEEEQRAADARYDVSGF